MKQEVINKDCLEYMKELPDNYFDLIITDPPYGIDVCKGGTVGGGKLAKVKNYGKCDWDNSIPSKEVFEEMLRVSKNQIIWGGNYFADYLPASQGWLVWNKGQRGFSLADGEMAWTSFDRAMRIFDYPRGVFLADESRCHPYASVRYLERRELFQVDRVTC
ncbi:hypothetical protein LCGC14_2682670 [marine sediment metagenome]|uniref:DNA methylase N-4/N-6 domain-containing protein n=1 Tax=marine sediment metagenome TaxID=412755 RepID=A0A0F9A8H1_9ZZZZ